MAKQMTIDEKRWQADADAETMARYEEIMKDANRRSAAVKAARARAVELTQRANAMQRAASTKSSKSTPKKK